ncbi:MAG: hypothetical protein GY719_05355 [bacterium]|nr:hypothetical protein [bacterium]
MFRLKPKTRRKPRSEVWRKRRPRSSRQVNLRVRAGTRRHRARKECERPARRELNPAMRDLRKTAEALYGRELGRGLHRSVAGWRPWRRAAG